MPVPAPKHDRVHPPREDPRWRESYYFSFFDTRLGIGGFSSIGKRPAKGHSGFINVLWGPRISTLVASEFDRVSEHDDVHEVAGLIYAAESDFGPWRLKFDGRLNDGGDGLDCDSAALGPTERSSAPKVDVSFDLTFTPEFEPYLYEERDEWRDLFDGHIDEVGRVTGELRIGSERHVVDGRGVKDHSWGVRDWFKPDAWRWIDLVGEGAPEAALWRASFGGEWVGDGALYGSGGAQALRDFAERIEERAGLEGRELKPLPEMIELELASDSMQLEGHGEIVRVVPIIFGRETPDGYVTSWNDRALVRFEHDGGSTAWANVEFERLVSGRPGR